MLRTTAQRVVLVIGLVLILAPLVTVFRPFEANAVTTGPGGVPVSIDVSCDSPIATVFSDGTLATLCTGPAKAHLWGALAWILIAGFGTVAALMVMADRRESLGPQE
jgi:uncharacterized membrane protein HdeD (DUF308 family)